MTHQPILSVAAAVTAVAAFAAPGWASAARPPQPTAVTVLSTYVDPAQFTPGGVRCTHLDTLAGRVTARPTGAGHEVAAACETAYVGESIFSGTFQGRPSYVEYGYVDTDLQGPYEGPDDFRDTVVVGCGRGDFVVDTYDGRIDTRPQSFHPGPPDHPEDGWFPAYNAWRLRPTTGPDGLPWLVSGSGVNHWKYYPFREGSEQSPVGEGTYTGTLTCYPQRAAGGHGA